MAFEVRVPRLGWSMETGIFLGWKKQDGDLIKVGDTLYELQGEKAAQEIESIDAGVLHISPDGPGIGAEVAVGALLAHISSEDEEPTKVESTTQIVIESIEQPMIVVSTQEEHAAQSSTPRARRKAAELGVDWREARGSGRGGRIRERDILEPAKNSTSGDKRIKVTRRRRVIARKMLESCRQTAPVTLTTKADATNLVSLRQQFKATDAEHVPTFTDIITKLIAESLSRHPALSGKLFDDQIVVPLSDQIHIGIAVDTEDGLLVVVLRDVLNQSLMHLTSQSRNLVDQARRGVISAKDTEGGVFTITNLGSFGIEAFTPIINIPESAILGLGEIKREVVPRENDQIIVRDQMTLSLTFDHQVVDGADAARFLKTVRVAIENPSAWLLHDRHG